ncbi:lytic polysaccharide monooxygenase [Trematosphaeria pertusa]|uniref:AA9 family lytic polysaccharide monooxygenase n=1 Tax=Trematosphaeria pertusa TaxID=390896 RepID=A0A6A6IYS6_9PLEO|nr:lytic polysaccharide monooxygenase [Trematosphaeria pertusa]KAF2254770.1 lytic polysaccharide monooxygenase [Trematosphaeria pertusa]
MKFSTSLALAAAASTASAHTIFVSLNGGKVGDGVRVPSYDGPITDVSSNDIVCNGGPNPTQKTSTIITVQAGSSAKLTWRHTLTSTASDVIDASHKGPVMAYMKKVSNAATDSGVGSGWFKIAEDGLDSSGKWGVDRLIANQGIQTVTIPQCIAPGQYLLRGELIALHGAQSANGAQFYMECAQINVTGGSASKTPSSVSLPGAYKASDPGILYNLYTGQKTYTAPGPSVFKC